MTFEEYQQQSRQTAVYPTIGASFIYPALGLADEAGEVAGKIKKLFRDDNGVLTEERRAGIANELGDVLWYIAQLCTELNLKMDDVASTNIQRLLSRKERGTLHGDGDNR